MYLIYLFACLCALAAATPPIGNIKGKQWALLVAGSKGWNNYRHQAAVSHAYQVVRKKGIPTEQIITMMYDDIANHPSNPFPGKIFTDYTHTNHYEGIIIDYREKEVTPDNFIKVLTGDRDLEAAGRKVVKSGPNDNIFVFFSDHGTTNLVAFPDKYLYADRLNDTLSWMYKNERYNKMVMYIEACESGSMFNNILPENMNIFVTTSANPVQSGWACFCDEEVFDTCLGDEYSVAWTADSEEHDITERTIQQQYLAVRKNTDSSEVCHYGDNYVSELNIGDFQGDQSVESKSSIKIRDRYPARRVHLLSTYKKLQRANSNELHELAEYELKHKLQAAQLVEMTFDYIDKSVHFGNYLTMGKRNKRETLECFQLISEEYAHKCYTIQKVPEVAEHLWKFDKLCQDGVDPESVVNAIDNICV